MHYVIGDIHNELKKFDNILEQISIREDDQVYILGDLFDRGGTEADPVGVYFRFLEIQGNCTWIRGNHDHWLAEFIHQYYSLLERKRQYFVAYQYNSFELLRQRLTEVDILKLADTILQLSLQKEIRLDGKKYLLAHAMTMHPLKQEKLTQHYLTGTDAIGDFFKTGIGGYISLLGHTSSSYMFGSQDGKFLDEKFNSIWINRNENVFLIDCGCGFTNGKLACLCLETGERFYSQID